VYGSVLMMRRASRESILERDTVPTDALPPTFVGKPRNA